MIPHADDEIIGCSTILQTGLVKQIICGTHEVMKECNAAHKNLPKKERFLCRMTTGFLERLSDFENHKNDILFFPDPIYEIHPEHRVWGAVGERLLREKGYNVIFYSINMQAPYVRQVPNFERKKELLNQCYPGKKSLWRYEHKYFLFEGYNKWIMTWED